LEKNRKRCGPIFHAAVPETFAMVDGREVIGATRARCPRCPRWARLDSYCRQVEDQRVKADRQARSSPLPTTAAVSVLRDY
jgi:hypothetical protein